MKQKLLTAAALTAMMAVPGIASAQDFDRNGWYLRGMVGAAGTPDLDITGQNVVDLTACTPAQFLSPSCVQSDINGDVESEWNVAGSLGLGYDLASPWRVELDGAQYWNDLGAISQQDLTQADLRTTTLMLNALYDFNEGGRFEPYVGAGLGVGFGEISATAHSRAGIYPYNPNGPCSFQNGNCVGAVNPVGSGELHDDDTVWAYQVIAGLGFNVTPRLNWDTQYRYVGMNDMDFVGTNAGGEINSTLENPAYHAVFTGLRWQFGSAPVAAPEFTCWDGTVVEMSSQCPTQMKTCWDGSEVAMSAQCPTQYKDCWDGSSVPVSQSCPPEVTNKTCWDGSSIPTTQACPAEPVDVCSQGDVPFVVYFEWDRSYLTDQAKAIIAQAAQIAQQCNIPGVQVVGHADSSGNAAYNVGLSQRRANAVAGELTNYGIPNGVITTSARGETELAVQTGDGVREPLNRRTVVTIRLAPATYN